jgi:penicillin V acylase-like amidase (Ntn superfamily)
MKLRTLLVADYANITQDNKVNIMGVFNVINAVKFPARHTSMYVVAIISPEFGETDQEKTFHLELHDDEGHAILLIDGPVQIQRNKEGVKPDTNVILRLDDIVLPKEGAYSFIAMMDGDHLGDVLLTVKRIDPSPRR